MAGFALGFYAIEFVGMESPATAARLMTPTFGAADACPAAGVGAGPFLLSRDTANVGSTRPGRHESEAVIGSAVVPTLIANAFYLPHNLLPAAMPEPEAEPATSESANAPAKEGVWCS